MAGVRRTNLAWAAAVSHGLWLALGSAALPGSAGAAAALVPLAAPDFSPSTCVPQPQYRHCLRCGFTGDDQAFTVPGGVRRIWVLEWGADGGGYFGGGGGTCQVYGRPPRRWAARSPAGHRLGRRRLRSGQRRRWPDRDRVGNSARSGEGAAAQSTRAQSTRAQSTRAQSTRAQNPGAAGPAFAARARPRRAPAPWAGPPGRARCRGPGFPWRRSGWSLSC
jgi:hypothetical protein